jgi:hypothetical protein
VVDEFSLRGQFGGTRVNISIQATSPETSSDPSVTGRYSFFQREMAHKATKLE